MKKELTCVVCPVGCKITAELDDSGKVIDVTGNTCPRGKKYAESEITHPVRTLTSTVKITDAENAVSMLPVKTSRPIPRESMFEAMNIIRGITVTAPINQGDIIASDFIEPGTNLIACKTVK